MKNILYIFLLTIFVSTGCERVFENEVESVTPPELHVFVKNNEGIFVEGVQVMLFQTQDDYTNKTNSLASKTTDSEGKAVFTETELSEPGMFYVHAEKDGVTNSASTVQTKYLLLNDGHTFFYTSIE